MLRVFALLIIIIIRHFLLYHELHSLSTKWLIVLSTNSSLMKGPNDSIVASVTTSLMTYTTTPRQLGHSALFMNQGPAQAPWNTCRHFFNMSTLSPRERVSMQMEQEGREGRGGDSTPVLIPPILFASSTACTGVGGAGWVRTIQGLRFICSSVSPPPPPCLFLRVAKSSRRSRFS
jgi:hypothetical protein